MMYTSGRFVPNSLLDSPKDQEEYVPNSKIKGKVQKQPLADTTNTMKEKKLKPMMMEEKRKVFKVDILVSDEDEDGKQTVFEKRGSKIEEKQRNRKNSAKQKEKDLEKKLEKIIENAGKERKIQKNKYQKIKQCSSEEQKQNLSKSTKSKLFNIQFSSSSESQSSSIEAQETKRPEGSKKRFSNKKKFIFEASQSGSSSESDECPIIAKKASEIESVPAPKEKNKFIPLNFGESSDDKEDDSLDEKEIQAKLFIMKQINFKSLMETYDDFLNAAIPETSVLSLIVKRDSKDQCYQIYDNNLLRNILTIKKDGRSLYRIYQKDMSKKSKGLGREAGKIKSNFLGTEFHSYYKKEEKGEKKHSISIKYETNILGLNGPRKMTVFVPTSNYLSTKYDNLLQLYENSAYKEDCGVDKYINKPPRFNEKINAYVLDFKGRATCSSVKNFILVKSQSEKKQYILFGKVGKDVFNLDVRYPFSIFQAVALGISSFQKKLGCQ